MAKTWFFFAEKPEFCFRLTPDRDGITHYLYTCELHVYKQANTDEKK